MTFRQVLRAPLLHFLVLGAALAGLDRLRPPSLSIPAGLDDAIRAQWVRETGRQPTPAEFAASRGRAIDEEVMVREALRLGLESSDPVVRSRLLKNLEFLSGHRTNGATGGSNHGIDGSNDDEAARLADARRLDMPARDPVARRRLVQLMEARLSDGAPLREADLTDFLGRHVGRYAEPERRAFRHVFFSRDSRDALAARQAASSALEQLTSGAASPDRLGDPFLLGSRFEPEDEGAIAARFGEGFAKAVAGAPPGTWVGPVESAYGLHLVEVESVVPAAAPSLGDLRSRVVWAALDEHEQANVRAGLDRLRHRYRLEAGGS